MAQVMAQKFFLKKDGRTFVIFIEGREVFVGTPTMFSNMGAQLVSHEAMKPLHWKKTRKIMILDYDGLECTGVGYRIPNFYSPKRAMKKLKKNFNDPPQV